MSHELSKRIANLSPEKRAELLKKVAAHKSAPGNTSQGLIPVQDRSRPLPLSFAQQRLWFIDQLSPGSPLYNVPMAVRLEGALDVALLEAALREVVRRHEVLRTTFREDSTGPVQVVAPEPTFTLEQRDLTGTDPEEAWRLAREAASRPFSLVEGPLVRALLLKSSSWQHLLVVVLHHIVSDGWSMALLVREVALHYGALAKGLPAPLPPLAVQYADFGVWQHGWLQGARLEKQLAYWRRQLSGAPSALELPTDLPRPAVRSGRGARHAVSLSRALTDALKALAQQEGASLFMVLLTGFQVLLSRYAGQEDVTVGSPMAGRVRGEVEGLIGLFVNTLVLRTQVEGSAPFRALLRQVRETVLSAQEHQELPFEKLVEELRPERTQGRTPYVQVMLTLQASLRGAASVEGVKLEALELDTHTAKFDLTLQVLEGEDGLQGFLEYDLDLFTAPTVARMAEHLRVLLEGAVARPHEAVSRLPLLTDAERHEVLRAWQPPRPAPLPWTSQHGAFEAQADLTPDAIAVVSGTRSLTYAQLEARASRLARHLRRWGVGTEVRVGLCVERSEDMLVAVLAVLKAGGTYVPLDPAFPADRLAYMVESSGMPVLVSQRSLSSVLPPHSARVVLLDGDAEAIAAEDGSPLRAPVAPESVAYVLFTSGSTGRPKGVQVPHGAVARFLAALQETTGVSAKDVLVAVTTLSFDIAVLELFLPLSVGARVVIATRDVAVDGARLAGLLEQSGATVLQATPSTWRLLLEAHWEDRGLTALTGGEALPRELAEALLARCGALWNVYGPTETTVWSTAHAVTSGPGSVPIGRPIPGTQAYVLDGGLGPVPRGVPGELFIGGEGVTRGYLHRPDLTAERFVPDVHGDLPGARVYRTGDRVRWAANGVLEYLNRVDNQVKLRGYRIELGEIEAVLGQAPGVRDAVVVVRGSAADARLVGYVVARPGQALEAAALRALMKERLPEYMVPSALVVLDAMPLTPNGKVDRKALPEPTLAPGAEREYVAPRTPLEQQVAELYTLLLNVPRVGVTDGFFELGGHSLLATRLTSRLRTAFQVDLPLQVLFESPTVEALAARIMTAGRDPHAASRPALVPVPRSGRLPTSLGQQRMWLLEQFAPGSAAYNMPFSLRLTGALDLELLRRALERVVHRHEPLRTTFQLDGDEPVQRIAPPAPLELPVVDLRALSPEQREAEVKRLTEVEVRHPFDLAAGPLLRVSVLVLDAREHLVLLTLHHANFDGWSMSVLMRELSESYRAFAAGTEPMLPELSLQYADFAAWQRQWLSGEELERQVTWWRQQLDGQPSVLELPTDRPRVPRASPPGALLPVALPLELTRAVEALCVREGITPFMFLVAALQVLIGRYSGQDDVSIGSSVASRDDTRLEGLLGLFINTLVLRTRMGGEPTVRELLGRVRTTTLGVLAQPYVPFEQVQPLRDLRQSPPFNVLFLMQNIPDVDLKLPGVTVRVEERMGASAKFDLTLSLSRSEQGFTGELEYATDLFDPSTVARMMRHLRLLVEGFVAAPERRVSSLQLLAGEERHQVLVEWNATRAPFPDACLHSLFEAQARATPDALAAVFEDASLTYAQLDARANQLAHALVRQGAGPEVPVALGLERSLDIPIGLLAILKAGAAWVPVDPLLPQERLAFMLQDSGARVLVTQSALLERFPETWRPRALCLDSQREALATESPEAPRTGVTPANLAYLLYTSGSTGTPKGTAIPHRNVANLVTHEAVAYGIGPGSRVLQFASLSFDLSVEEIFTTLCGGATLVLAPLEKLMPGAPLPALLRHQRVSVISLTPAALAATSPEALPEVRTVISGGEALPSEVVSRWAPGRRLLNTYGPTEATVIATLGEVVADGGVPSIGRPLANVRAYVLDALGAPVPVGVRGELFVGGVGVARGYAGRPSLTAERFIPDAFSEEAGARLYRTGDVVRWRQDGSLDFVGRIDAQVKVRGFRIELGEVEAVLRSAPGVKEAVVVAREDVPGDRRLVAYLVADAHPALDVSVLRAHLKLHLPEYMVPAAFVPLDALPLTSNGKVDRKALPAPEASQLRASHAYEAPVSPLEEKLAALWSEVLRQPSVGRSDNFFELGGHSLLATQLVARVRAALDVELPLRALFEAPTIALLAERLRQATSGSRLPPLIRTRAEGPQPLSFAQQRLWFLDQLTPDDASYNLPVALRLLGPVDTEALRLAFESLVARHEALRTTFFEHEGQPFQRIQAPGVWALPLVDLSELESSAREAEALRLATQEARQTFHLGRGPLLRTCLLRLSEEAHVLLVTMHHIVSDGWSMSVLVRELAGFYEAFSTGRTPALPPLPVQYADFATWQRQWLQGDVLRTQLDYWKQQLSGAPNALELPTDRPRPPLQSRRGASVPVSLSRELTDALRALAQREGATPFMLLLAAFQVLLSRYSGQDDISVGSPIAGRTHSEAEGLIGFFVNTLVLRSRVRARDTFRELLAQVRGTTLAAYEHQHLPFEKLVEVLQPSRDLSRSALFQALFVLQNAPAEALRVTGLSFQPVPLEANTSRFDLALTLFEVPQGLTGFLEYSSDLFDASTAQRLMAHFGVLLEAIAAQPETRVSALPLMTAGEQARLLVEWNATDADFPRDTCVHLLVAEQALRAPEAPALRMGERTVSYAGLEAWAHHLAVQLHAAGVSRGDRVAVLAERSPELVAGLLATLKVGAAYVPLSPGVPPERLAFMLEDCAASALLCHPSLRASLPPLSTHVLSLETDVPAVREPLPSLPVGADDLAYVIYTSGSTGRPKGVAVHHRGLMNLVTWHQRTYALTPEDRTALTAGVAFDASTWEVWPSLASGACLVVPPDAVRAEPALLLRWLASEAITTCFMPTPLAEAVLREPWPDALPLRALLTGGDALHLAPPPSLPATLFNHYGPTESTVVATFTPVPASTREDGTRPPIGRPIANTRTFVLDEHLRPVPIGVSGELFLDSAGLAWGYLGQPALTAERFLPHPFASAPGARLYRTGDVVRWRADGQLDYLQRLDFQVKVRGFRIELGEIEASLLAHPSVQEAVVLAREDVPGDKRLVAYLVARPGLTLDVEALRVFLKQRLPEYMVPSAFLTLEALPLTSNGKLDRKALPAPDASPLADFVAPRTPFEVKLAEVFALVLRREQIGIHDDFFALGGHSLLATQLVSRVRSTFDVELPLRALFEAPTVAALAERLHTAAPGPRLPPLTRADLQGPQPLSFAQQRLWLLEQLQPGDVAYNIPAALRLTGRVDTEALRRAFEAVVARHDSLRTTLVTHEGQPAQHLHAPTPWSLPLLDVSSLPEAQREQEARDLANREARRPFDLEAGPLLRTALVRLTEEAHLLLVTMHHIVSDGWSMSVLVRDVVAFYEAFTSGRAPTLPPLPVQYADFAAWQRQWLQGQVLDAQLGYWKQQLSGAPSALELPTDRPRPPVRSQRGAAVPVRIPQAVSESIQALARREGATPFMTLLAAFQVLLSRYSGQDDISVGSPIAGRTQAETEGLIGVFINTLVLRSRLHSRDTFRELLAQVRGTTLAAYEHQHLPFEKLVEAVQPTRDLSRNALFQVMFVLQNTPAEPLRVPGLSFEQLTLESHSAKFDLTLTLQESPQGFLGAFEYNTDLFDASTVQRMAGHLGILLEALAAKPETSLANLPLLTAPEHQRLLVDWNGPRVDFPRDTCLHDAFAAQALRTPEALAVVCRDQHLSFRELDARANQLAHRLIALGVGPDTRVVLCVERSVEALVGILGTLKAGGAYVPIDPSYPREWLAHVLQDTAAPVVLTQRHLKDTLPPHAAHDVCLDSDAADLARESREAPRTSVTPEHLAYVIYTSGSTGRPKGVMIQHRSVLNLRLALASTVHASAGDSERVSVNAPLSFDASVKQLIQVLDGHTLCIVPDEARADVGELVARIEKDALDVLDCSPAHLRLLLDEGLLTRAAVPRRVLVGGEAVDPATWRHLASTSRPRVFNVYGPTECTVDATACAFDASPTPTIGRPLPNVRVYVLDRSLQPVPVGVSGELFIGGEGVARGYLGRPELTADRFIPDAFSPTPGARLYRTGDVVRWRQDGMLDYLGRADFQVKVRGFRIELGEIEARLLAHPGVHAAVVLAREDVPGDKRLVAYLVAEEGEVLDTAGLRSFLKQHLPEYMVPAAFLVLEALPLNTNGKVDRKALPAPQGVTLASSYVAPSTSTEEQLAALFTQVLRVERVGVHDDFFALGGHSLLATQLVSRVRSTFQRELPLRALFEAPTVAALAQRIDSGVQARPLPSIPAMGASTAPLSFAQQRLWFLDQLNPGDASYNIPTALRLKGRVDIEALRRAFEALVARHESLRTTFREHQGQATQHIHAPEAWTLPLIDLAALPEASRDEEAHRQAMEASRRPFDLEAGPLLRTALVRLTEEEHLLLVTMHHIVSDGWSMSVLVRDVVAFYEAFSAGHAPSLAPLPVQYADFAMWQRQWLQGQVLDTQLGYWKRQLSGAPSALELPTDRPHPALQSYAGAAFTFSVPRMTSEALKALAVREGATPFMVLLAGFQVLLSRYSAQEDLLVGTPIAGRTQAETEGLVGFFVNTLVLRARVRPEDSFRKLLAQVRGTTLAAYEHQHLPFEKLIEAVQPVRDPSRSPLFQVMFVLQNTPAEALRVPGLSFQEVVAAVRPAKFDLTLTLQDSPQGFFGVLDYSTALFERGTIERLASHLGTLLESIAATPEQSVAELPLFSHEERQRLLVDWNDTAVTSPTDVPVHVHFARQALSTPHAVALVLGDGVLTYARLEARANQLAHHLISLGIAPGAHVGLAVERSFELVVALLAILKAGAAFVPVDRNAPMERIAALLEDADVSVTLAHESFESLLPASGICVWMDDMDRLVARQPTHAPDIRVDGEALAYVMFTSGSTGRPKGVCVPHRGITRLVLGSDFMRFGPEEVWLQFAPVAFDASTLEIWGALLHGSKLVLAPPHALSLEELAAQLRLHRVTSLWLTAALFEQMALHQGEALAGVRQVLSGGDVLPAVRVREHLSRLSPDAVLINGYGPTENTTFSATFRMHHGTLVQGAVPIGKPLSNSTVYALDALLRPVPVGVAGEVYVGGLGLAWGYLRRPELTAERFVPHPFASTPGARLYRTGDKARWRTDGTLDFLGRVDFQVKVRGFRIELGEIEASLRSASGVSEAIVVARGTDGDKRLIGYVTAREDHSLDVDTLKAHLQQHLPEYMVPSALVVLETLPLNANGKVDRKALPEPGETPRAASFIAPRTPTEERLAALFTEVLRVERVGVHDDFFELGGHSLLATQLVSRVRAAFGVELPLRTLFAAPTVEALVPHLEGAQAASLHAPALVPASRDAALPLSFAQQRLWLLDQLSPGDASYNIPSALRLTGRVDAEALRRAFEALVARHESLRTVLSAGHDAPSQHIQPPTGWELPLIDLTLLAGSPREEQARRLVATEARRPFQLATGPLLRTTLVRLAEAEHLLLVTMHHIVSDGWSMSVLVRELVAFYEAFTSGRAPSLAPLPVQYADFAVWQRQWLQGDALEAQLGYWKQQLAGAPPALELPTDRPRPPVPSQHGARVDVRIPAPLSHALKALAQHEGATPFMVMLAAFQLLLSRYSGQDDISVGSPIAGRTQAETEGLIGFFVNTLVLRAHVEPGATFRELLVQVRGTTLAAYDHQHLPFEKLVEAVQSTRDLSRSPLFQSMFVLQNAPAEALRVPGLSLQPLPSEAPFAKFDLSLGLQEVQAGMVGALEYATDLFDPPTIQRMAGHLGVLLEAIAANPDSRLDNLPLLTDAERHQLLVEWNPATVTPPGEPSLHAKIEAQVRRTPDAVAVITPERQLTYRQLDARANQLAHRLIALGVGPEVRVGLCVERTEDLLIGTLGILKAGGAYVPLDPSYPRERLAWLLEDAQGPALVAHSHLLTSLPPTSATAVCLDAEEALALQPTSAPVVDVRPGNLAYLIYTSGSTGRPKGVAISHANALAFLHWALETFSAEELKGVLAATSLNFDLSVFELFAPLARGGAVVVARNALHLAELPTASHVTLVNTVPSAMAQLLRLGAVPPGVRVVNLAGEALPETLAKAVHALPTVHKLFNLYGPSEDTTYSTASLVGRDEVPHIGRPLPGTRAYVLDASLRPVPVGVAGELFLAGEGQARGYLLRPELTAERFLPEPHGPPGGRMYRTGDRVRYRDDGHLEYLGRVDFQVKVRGFRIELGEVESALRRAPAIKDAVVVARGEAADKRLVAYVVPTSGASLEAESLKAHLRQHLPEYMVPGAVVVLESLPLNANGKVDRKALPEPDAATSTHAYEAPRTETEAKLAAIWAEVLRLPRVGVRDSFFELGGHSLLATQVVSRVRSELSVELPLRALFEAPTVEALATRLTDLTGTRAPSLTRVSREAALPLSFAQQRLWLIDQLEPGSALYNLPVAVRLDGHLRADVLERALQEVVRRHEALRTTFSQVEGEPVQRIHSEVSLPLGRVDLSDVEASLRDAEARARVAAEMRRPFDLRSGPLVRTLLFKLAEQEHILLVCMHHVVSDGWSLGVLVREVGALYTAFCQDLPSPLPGLPVQYADYAAWQRQALSGEALQREVAYWDAKLSGAPAVLELPTDFPRPAVRGTSGARLDFSLSRELTQKLRGLAHREGGSLFMALLAGWHALLSRYSGQDDISVGSPIAGRTQAETEGLIGFFVNTLVLRARVEARESFRALLQQVRATVLEAYEHQHVPFEKLVETLQPSSRSLGHTPLFQTLLTLQNVPSEALRLPGLRLQGLDFEQSTAKFDVSVFFAETPDGLRGAVEYSTALFERGTIERLASHLSILLEALASNPEQAVAELPLLSREERQRLLVDWNDTAVVSPTDVPVHVHFARQALRSPHAVALALGEEVLTYARLEARANQLAWHLISLGVAPGAHVGLAVERSFELVVALLAILKAGAAFVPVDRNAPVERIAALLEDADVHVTLTHQPFASLLPASGTRVWLDAQQEVLTGLPTHAPDIRVDGEALAYVMFTSGSTGRPKGVCVPHRGITRLVLGSDFMRFGPDEVWLQFAPVAFDASTLEIWGALLHGAKLILAPPHALSLEELAAQLRLHRVTSLWLTAALFEQMALHQGEALASVRQVLSGGDVLPAVRVREHLSRLSPDAVLINGYGPTENTTFSATFRMRHDSVVQGAVPIGKPLSNSTVYVLDAHLRPVPVGVAGEVYVSGLGLAWGYLRRPELTAERFIPHPFASTSGERLYRTGDKARWRTDGTLDFLGRVDFQVKVRGFRIELGEIEVALRASSGVSEAVVVASGTDGDKRLVAYVTTNEGASLDVDTLKAHLRQHLPEYMVPGVVVLDALPLNANGKVDRKALPEPDAKTSDTRDFIAPRDALELQLALIWQDVLGLPAVSVLSSFFDLGGHSLLAVRMVAAVRERLGLSLPLSVLFQQPTIALLARVLRDEARPWSPLVPLERGAPGQRPFFLVHPGGGNVLAYAELARRLGPELPVFGLQSRGLDGGPVVESIEEMASLYLDAVRSVQPQGPYRLGGWSLGGLVAFEMSRQLRASGETVELLALVDSHVPGLTQPPQQVSRDADPARVRIAFAHATASAFGHALTVSDESLSENDDDAMLAHLLEEGLRARILDAHSGPAQLRALFQVFRANLFAQERYVPRPYEGTALLLSATGAAPGSTPISRHRGWEGLVQGGLEVQDVPGGHHALMQEPSLDTVVERLREALQRVSQGTTES
ncbi:MAG: non-ribosomal peptide synthetase [Myxococcaceae bacterium]|nr:MAG: non-ribosomal peptide synthetase [Myxococcaceae bacterium]